MRLPVLITCCLLFFIPLTIVAQLPKASLNFSYVGYEGSNEMIPAIPTVLRVQPSGGDDTRLLQAAINAVGKMPLQKNGYRGAIELSAGTYKVSGELKIETNGIVLRGMNGNSATKLVATGKGRRTIINIGNYKDVITDKPVNITDEIVAVGSMKFHADNIDKLKVGDGLVITRPCTKEWIKSLGMDTSKGAFPDLRVNWNPNSRNIYWRRTITAVDAAAKEITIDAPITTAIEKRYGGGTIAEQLGNLPIKHVGLDQLVIESEFNKANRKDEDHSWIAVAVNNAEDVFVSNITARHFAGSAVRVGDKGRKVTIYNCRNVEPVSELGGYRRQSFLIDGQQVLVYKCYAEEGMNDFAVGFCSAGPNVFLDCVAKRANDASGSFESWASGVLYDNVQIEGAPLRITFDMKRTQGGGWTAANSVLYNCTAKELVANGPDEAPNAIVSEKGSLFENQLKERTSKAITALLTTAARPSTSTAKLFTYKGAPAETKHKQPLAKLQIVNGRFVVNGNTVWGGSVNDAWWMGQVSPTNALDAGISITRFVPGRVGPGLTEDLPQLAERVKKQGTPFYQSGPCLWYDRRRDDHTVEKRDDWNVWAPFYEMPWARSGQGISWEGLSKFDLSKYNEWYFSRVKEFADLCNQQGIVLYHSFYNTHNVLEIGAHWADFPWRPANNINRTSLPEPPPMEPNNRLHVANQFYNTDFPNQKALHVAYINHVLDQLGRKDNIIFNVGFQYAGPLDFQKFFIRTVAAWEEKNKHKVRLSLATSKDLTDSVLQDPELAKHIAVVDMRYWQYRPDGTLWAPKAGQNLAFREMVTKEFKRSGDAAPATTPEQAYRQVREYKDKYPSLVLVSWHNDVTPLPSLMAGAAQVLTQNPTAGHGQGRSVDRNAFDDFVDTYLKTVLMQMNPKDDVAETGTWCLADKDFKNILLYSLNDNSIVLKRDLLNKNYQAVWYNHETKQTVVDKDMQSLKAGTRIAKPGNETWLLYLKMKE